MSWVKGFGRGGTPFATMEKNFMTPDIDGYWEHEPSGIHAEISFSTGNLSYEGQMAMRAGNIWPGMADIFFGPMVAVTFRPEVLDGKELPSGLVSVESLTEAREWLEAFDPYDFEEQT